MNGNDTPLVTVIMPAYNAGAFIGESIASVLAQQAVSFELLVVDDCSTDDTAARVAAFDDARIRLVRMAANGGVSAATNRGMQLARGRYYARLDADDLMLPGRLARQAAFMEAHPQTGCCGGAVEVFGEGLEPYRVTYPQSESAIRCAMLFGNPYAHSSLMVRMDAVREAGVIYDETLRQAEDYDFIERLSHGTGLANLPEVLVRYRRHAGQVTEKQGRAMRDKRGMVRSRYVRRVFSGLLPEQVLLHDILAETDAPVDSVAVPEIGELLLYYARTGAERFGIGRDDLERTVAVKWLNVCHRAGLGARGVWRYFASPLRRLGPPRYAGEAALVAKWLRRAVAGRKQEAAHERI